jgi:hypothetical protein
VGWPEAWATSALWIDECGTKQAAASTLRRLALRRMRATSSGSRDSCAARSILPVSLPEVSSPACQSAYRLATIAGRRRGSRDEPLGLLLVIWAQIGSNFPLVHYCPPGFDGAGSCKLSCAALGGSGNSAIGTPVVGAYRPAPLRFASCQSVDWIPKNGPRKRRGRQLRRPIYRS